MQTERINQIAAWVRLFLLLIGVALFVTGVGMLFGAGGLLMLAGIFLVSAMLAAD